MTFWKMIAPFTRETLALTETPMFALPPVPPEATEDEVQHEESESDTKFEK